MSRKRFEVVVDWVKGTSRADVTEDELRAWLGRALARDFRHEADRGHATGQGLASQVADDELGAWWLAVQGEHVVEEGIQVFDDEGGMVFILGPAIFALHVIDHAADRPLSRQLGFAHPDLRTLNTPT